MVEIRIYTLNKTLSTLLSLSSKHDLNIRLPKLIRIIGKPLEIKKKKKYTK